jgi:OmpR family response regulator RpaB
MVVDDSAVVRRMLATRLRHAGFDVVEAAGGEEALQRFGRQPVPVVVTDVSMPGVGGLHVLAELQLDQYAPEVILLSGTESDDGQTARRARQLGAHAHIRKAPTALETVVLAVEGALETWRGRHNTTDGPTPHQVPRTG